MIGIMGGTFDPIHNGHLQFAIEIAETFNLQEIRVIPCHIPSHRQQSVATPQQRMEMVKLAIQNESRFILDQREFKRKGASYTFDTLVTLREEFGQQISFNLIIGTDAFQFFDRWYRWKEILKLTHIIVAYRPNCPHRAIKHHYFESHYTNNIRNLKNEPAGFIYFMPVTQLAISASLIRKKIRQKQSVKYLLPSSVWHYVNQHHIYEKQ